MRNEPSGVDAVPELRERFYGADAPNDIDISPNRLDDLDDVRSYIESIDFGPLASKLSSPLPEGLGWDPKRTAHAERLYRNWFFLTRKHEGTPLVPTRDIDEFWHAHILDTRAYHRDCDHVFGYYRHHFPYFGIRSENDRKNLMAAAENTQWKYHAEFNTFIHDWDDVVDPAG